jgi:4-amino-4-deoxy-L-arabinose transferase-like glycosyltransferase
LATLAKGPVAMALAGLVIGAFIVLRREWELIAKTLWIPGLLVYALVTLPWFVLVQRANPEFLRVFILEHNLARFGTNMFRHNQPFWYFVPVLLVGALPWMVPAIAALLKAIRDGIGGRLQKTGSFELFFALWTLLPVIFFSFSQSKLPGYILPSLPPLGILLAEYLWRRSESTEEPGIAFALAHSIMGGLLIGFALLTNYFALKLKPASTAIWISIIVGVLVCAAMAVTIYAKGIRTVRFVTLVPVVLGLAFVIKFATPSIDAKMSSRALAEEIEKIQGERSPVKVAVFDVSRNIEYGLNFYENKAIASYERREVPASDHLVLARHGEASELTSLVGGRRVSRVGEYEPQKLEIFWISNAPAHQH